MLDVGEFAPQGRQFLSHIHTSPSLTLCPVATSPRASRCPSLNVGFKFWVQFLSRCHFDVDLNSKSAFVKKMLRMLVTLSRLMLRDYHNAIAKVAVVTAAAGLLLHLSAAAGATKLCFCLALIIWLRVSSCQSTVSRCWLICNFCSV